LCFQINVFVLQFLCCSAPHSGEIKKLNDGLEIVWQVIVEFYEFCWVHESLTNIIRLIQQLDVRLHPCASLRDTETLPIGFRCSERLPRSSKNHCVPEIPDGISFEMLSSFWISVLQVRGMARGGSQRKIEKQFVGA
jgi:hypothetical protein